MGNESERDRELDIREALELIGTDVLLEELSHRYTGFVFAYDRPSDDGGPIGDQGILWHGMSVAHALGLADYAHLVLKKESNKICVSPLPENLP
jgi:hypothetical protein